jgi:hypothetical protein
MPRVGNREVWGFFYLLALAAIWVAYIACMGRAVIERLGANTVCDRISQPSSLNGDSP